MKDFEGYFSDFLDSTEYDKAEEAVFSFVRMAFKAGWIAAGGEAPSLAKVSTKYADSSDEAYQKG